jgi:methyl-accepting chemotaxis protein
MNNRRKAKMQLTIKRKLSMAFVLAGSMMLGGTGVAYWAQIHGQETQEKIEKTDATIKDLEHLIGYIGRVTSAQRAYLISGDPRAVEAIPALRVDAKATSDRISAAIADDEEQKAHFAQYQVYIQQRIAFVNKLNATRKDKGPEAANALFNTGEDDRLLGLILPEFEQMKDLATARLNAEEAANRKLQAEIGWTELIGVSLAVLMLAAVAFTLIRSIHKNVEISVGMLHAMARKDLSGADGVAATNDELATAIGAINQMKAAMTEALIEVARSSTQVAAAGAEIESTAREIAGTSHEEQRNVEQFASSLAEMNATVKDVAEHAERASLAANGAVETATTGREVVRETQAAMNRISETVQTASNDIATLGKETQGISEVVRIIQEIAEQTNLLALNAAIEAARAGEQGKGFAVVAQEVRVLAERTAKFTKEIAEKIEKVQAGAGRAVESMREGEAVVNEGVNQFTHVGAAFEAITQRVEAAQQGIAMIATATTEQSSATEGLTENIHLISSEVSKTTAQVDQTALACAELAKLADALQHVVDGFQLPSAAPAPKAGYGKPFVHRRVA